MIGARVIPIYTDLLFLSLGDDDVVCKHKDVDGFLLDVVFVEEFLFHPKSKESAFSLQLAAD